ncbi:phage terminase family protein [Candidatus Binatia bacterium]|nr:phage terminase family protein [Candidatus Binatia bacterium]
MTIVEAMRDPALFGRWFSGESWAPWFVALRAVFGLPLARAEMDVYHRHTGRQLPPAAPAREVWLLCGRRGGKSLVASTVAVFLACFRDWTPVLAPGEVATIALIAADRRQARTLMRYISGFFDGVPLLARMVANRTRETIELDNRVVIEIHTASFRATRGYTLAGVVADEVAFWPTDEHGVNPDTEILNGLRPGLATTGGMLLCITSPYARKGAAWEAYRRNYGQDHAPVLVWQASTRAMNATVPLHVIDEAYASDPAAAAAEWGAEFRTDVETYVPRDAVDRCVVQDRREFPPSRALRYVAFVDPSGGSVDSMTLAIAHAEGDRAVLDLVREWRPPFSPAVVVAEACGLLREYGIHRVRGDRYGGVWPRERFAAYGVTYTPCEQTRSELYQALLPRLMSGTIELLDDPRLVHQLSQLERRTGRSGKDSVDHAPGQHDDVANAAAGALVTVGGPYASFTMVRPLIV